MSSLAENLTSVRTRIRHACARSGRDPSSVTLIAVTKTVLPERIREAVRLGVTELGENRVQEARDKRAALGGEPIRWHLIGHLQRNKAKLAVELFDAIQSVDSVELIEELERHAANLGRTIPVLIQVNVSGEASKFGCQPGELTSLVEAVGKTSHLKMSGLMTIPPFTDNPEEARPTFRSLRELRDALQSAIRNQESAMHLSMGMSNDFDVAIEEGATMVRVGTAIFGSRG